MQLRRILLCCVLLSPNLYAGDSLVGKRTCLSQKSHGSCRTFKGQDTTPRIMVSN
jgi:hypothetical protein